jgi:hypothetical protein
MDYRSSLCTIPYAYYPYLLVIHVSEHTFINLNCGRVVVEAAMTQCSSLKVSTINSVLLLHDWIYTNRPEYASSELLHMNSKARKRVDPRDGLTICLGASAC